MPEKACAAVFTLYIQNIKFKGAIWTFSKRYNSSQINALEKNTLV